MSTVIGRRVLPALPRVSGQRSAESLWRSVLEGKEPAEILSTRDREDLIVGLLDRGWSVDAIAEHTRQTEYTVRRIRDRALGSPAGDVPARGAA